MQNIDILKNKAHLLYEDYESRTLTIDSNGNELFEYHPKTFDIQSLFHLFGYDHKEQKKFSYDNALHMIAQMVGANKWQDLINKDNTFLESACLLISSFKNADDVLQWLLLKEATTPWFFNFSSDVHYYVEHPEEHTYKKLLQLRLNYTYGERTEIPKLVITKQNDKSFVCTLTKFDDLISKGKTEVEATDNFAKEYFAKIETQYILEQNEFVGQYSKPIKDYTALINYLIQYQFIQFPKEIIKESTDKKGNPCIFYSFTCKRFYKTIHHEGCFDNKEEAMKTIKKQIIDNAVKSEKYNTLI